MNVVVPCCLPETVFNQNLVSAGSPRVDGSQARFPISKLKLDNLFLQWLSMAESQSLVTYDKLFSWSQQVCTCYSPKTVVLAQVLSLLEDAKAGRQLARPVEAASPLSPSAAQNLFAATTVSCILTKMVQSWLHAMWPMDVFSANCYRCPFSPLFHLRSQDHLAHHSHLQGVKAVPRSSQRYGMQIGFCISADSASWLV